ncbi:MAG: hypothetical protein FD120_2813, partial [Gammaproteobacteria bacterium]
MDDFLWRRDLERLVSDRRQVAGLKPPRFAMFGQLISCVDYRCGAPVYG